MSTMMQQLTLEVSKHVIEQITSKLLPAISEKYDISMDELMELVGGGGSVQTQKPTTIKATPKASSKAASTKSSVSASSAPKGLLDALQKKIEAAKAVGKVLNVSSGRPLADTAANRKKFKFYDEIGIAGVAGDQKLSDALQLFGPPPKKEAPVHEQAAKAKQRAKAMTGSGDEDAESDAEDKATTGEEEDEASPPPSKPTKSVTTKSKKESQPSDESAPKATFSVKKTVVKPKPEAVKPAVVTKPPQKVVQAAAKTVVTKPPQAAATKEPTPQDDDDEGDDAVDEGNDEGNDEENDKDDNVDTIVKLSNLIEETNTKVDAEEKAQEPKQENSVTVTVTEKPLVSKYNPKIRQWWNPDTSFVLKRKGVKTFVIGKLVNDKVAALSESDLLTCQQNNWPTDLPVAKTDEQTGSQSDDDDS